MSEVTILIPNYRTPEITRLCLRLIRKYTDPALAETIVIDNDSKDESTEYLRSLKWIQLIERPSVPDEDAPTSHAMALDLGLAQVRTPYVLSMHTDTIVRRRDWLEFLVAQIRHGDDIAGVGSWKLESKPFLRRLAKRAGDLLGGGREETRYLRSHCALYRTALIRDKNLSFSGGRVAGKVIHETLVAEGHQMVFLPSETLIRYVLHLNHATMIINEGLGARAKTISKGQKRIRKYYKEIDADAILADRSLDE